MHAVIACVVVLAAAGAYGQAYGSTLTLDPIPSAVYAGDTVTFTGTLTSGGSPVSGATVHICEDDPFIPDECLVRATTGRDGRFSVNWVAQEQAAEVELDIYAKFDGDGRYSSGRSSNQYMDVYEAASLQYAATTTVRLFAIPSWVFVGDVVVFEGTLTFGGSPVPGRTVWICEDDPFVPDQCLARTTTNSAGEFYVEWTAEAGLVETDFDIYAEFDGDGSYPPDQTPRYTMSVYKYGGTIRLDSLPDQAEYGDVITLSGTLSLDAHSPEGSVVYIKDEDTLGFDDLLTTAFVNASGHFTTSWIVSDVDLDSNIDIQAVYESNSFYYRLATSVQELYAYGNVTGPGPGPGVVTDDVYMTMYRSLNFDRAPLVAIVPSPYSYDEVRKHIVPVQEGVLGLVSVLERQYPAGDWDVDFVVVQPGDSVDVLPDVAVNLVTRDDTRGDEWECDWDKYSGGTFGWAPTLAPKPVPTWVCSYDDRTNEQIGATAVHEFVHAIGLGHTFNLPGDLMCSIENDGPTCPGDTGPKSTTFSQLNLDALVAIYGTDGFTNPNNRIDYLDRFDAGNP